MSSKPIGQHPKLERALSLEIVRVTERAAVAAARFAAGASRRNPTRPRSMPCAAN